MDLWNFVPNTYNEIVKGLLPKYTVENNMTTLKVFGSAPLEEDKNLFLYSVALDTSKDICAQITQCLYLEDWGRVDVVDEQDRRTTIDLNYEIEKIANMKSTDQIQQCMRIFKSRFNAACTAQINVLRKGGKKVWLEVYKRFPPPEWEQVSIKAAHVVFEAINEDNNGLLSQKEFVKLGMVKSVAVVQGKFDKALPEYKVKVCQIVGIPNFTLHNRDNEQSLAQRRFYAVDKNGDKNIDWGEFCDFYHPVDDLKHELWNGVLERK